MQIIASGCPGSKSAVSPPDLPPPRKAIWRVPRSFPFFSQEIRRFQDAGKLDICRTRKGDLGGEYAPRYFFHGTSLEIVEKILNVGFRLSKAGLGSML